MAKKYSITTTDGMVFEAPTQAEAMKMAQDWAKSFAPTTASTSVGKGKVKDTPFTKHDGSVIMCTKAQAEVYKKRQEGFANKEANLKAWEEKRATYKPSQALIKAIKADRASITHKIAKEQYDFVGTKDDLRALKDKVCK